MIFNNQQKMFEIFYLHPSYIYRDQYSGELAVTSEDLMVLSTVREITGFLVFEPYNYAPAITTLDAFKNLRKIHGAQDEKV